MSVVHIHVHVHHIHVCARVVDMDIDMDTDTDRDGHPVIRILVKVNPITDITSASSV